MSFVVFKSIPKVNLSWLLFMTFADRFSRARVFTSEIATAIHDTSSTHPLWATKTFETSGIIFVCNIDIYRRFILNSKSFIFWFYSHFLRIQRFHLYTLWKSLSFLSCKFVECHAQILSTMIYLLTDIWTGNDHLIEFHLTFSLDRIFRSNA